MPSSSSTTTTTTTTTMTNKKSKDIQKRILKGHKASVSCLAHTSSSFSTTISTSSSSSSSSFSSTSKKRRRKKTTTTTTTTTTSTLSENVENRPCCLLSGSEDGTARLWDLRESCKRASLCIVPPPPQEEEEEEEEEEDGSSSGVNSVAFEPIEVNNNNNNTNTKEEEEEDTASSYSQHFTVFLSVNNKVYGYDLRKNTSPILHYNTTPPTYNLSDILQNQDEVNQISFSHTILSSSDEYNKRTRFMATADDFGQVKIINSLLVVASGTHPKSVSSSGGSSSSSRVVHHAQDGNVAMTTSALFRPPCCYFLGGKGGGGGKNKKNTTNVIDLATGGTDCFVRLWDIMRPGRPTFSFSTQNDPNNNNNNSSSANQMCNPPMVHSLAWSPSGRYLSAGLGDGTTCILSVEKRTRKLIQYCRLMEDERHGGSIASVLYPNLVVPSGGGSGGSSGGGEEEVMMEMNDRLFVTAGNDGNVLLWDLGKGVGGCGYGGGDESIGDERRNADPATLFYGCGHDDGDGTGGDGDDAAASLGKMSISSASASQQQQQPRVLFGIPHEQKPNWMVCSSLQDPIMPNTLFVCDTSCDITAYVLPCR